MRLKGKIAIVTGAADGLGLAISEALGREGASVIMSDIQDEKCDAEAARIFAKGPGQAMAAHCDVSVTAEVDSVSRIPTHEMRIALVLAPFKAKEPGAPYPPCSHLLERPL